MSKEQDKGAEAASIVAKTQKVFYDAFIGAGFNPVQALTLTVNLFNVVINKQNNMNFNDNAFWQNIKKYGSGLS